MKNQENTVQKKQRDSSIEIARIYACIMVVWAHIQISYIDGDKINKTGLVIKNLIGDNVPVFLLILGFFAFAKLQGDDRMDKLPGVYWDKIKGFLVNVYIPTIIVTFLAALFYGFVYGQCSFGAEFTAQGVHRFDLLSSYILKQAPEDMVGQFWYIVKYIRVIVFFPLLAVICHDDRAMNRIRRSYLAVGWLYYWIQDISYLKNTTAPVDLKEYVFDNYMLYVILGYEIALFLKKIKWERWQICLLGAGCLVLGVWLRYGLTIRAFSVYGFGQSSYFSGLGCAPSYLSSAGVLILCCGLFRGMHNALIQYLGALTFYVFCFHGAMLRIFGTKGQQIQTHFGGAQTGHGILLYYVVYGGLIFATAFVLGVIMKFLYDRAVRGLRAVFTSR